MSNAELAMGPARTEEAVLVVLRLGQLEALEEKVRDLTVEASQLVSLASRLRARSESPTWRS